MLTVGGALHVWGRDKWELLSVEFYYEPPKIKLINRKKKERKKSRRMPLPTEWVKKGT